MLAGAPLKELGPSLLKEDFITAAAHQYIQRKIVPIIEKRLDVYLQAATAAVQKQQQYSRGQASRELTIEPNRGAKNKASPTKLLPEQLLTTAACVCGYRHRPSTHVALFLMLADV
jgi:hypothetical protein